MSRILFKSSPYEKKVGEAERLSRQVGNEARGARDVEGAAVTADRHAERDDEARHASVDLVPVFYRGDHFRDGYRTAEHRGEVVTECRREC